MNKLLKIFILTAFFFASIGVVQPYAAEWYESMESSSLDQSYAVMKNISTSGSMTQRPDVQQAIAEISESVSREAAQIAESASVRELNVSHLSGDQGDRVALGVANSEDQDTVVTGGGGGSA